MIKTQSGDHFYFPRNTPGVQLRARLNYPRNWVWNRESARKKVIKPQLAVELSKCPAKILQTHSLSYQRLFNHSKQSVMRALACSSHRFWVAQIFATSIVLFAFSLRHNSGAYPNPPLGNLSRTQQCK